MSKVGFNSENDILDMVSPEGETVEFVQPVVTYQKAVEMWMGELEDQMRQAIRGALEVGVGSYPGLQSERCHAHGARRVVPVKALKDGLEALKFLC